MRSNIFIFEKKIESVSYGCEFSSEDGRDGGAPLCDGHVFFIVGELDKVACVARAGVFVGYGCVGVFSRFRIFVFIVVFIVFVVVERFYVCHAGSSNGDWSCGDDRGCHRDRSIAGVGTDRAICGDSGRVEGAEVGETVDVCLTLIFGGDGFHRKTFAVG